MPNGREGIFLLQCQNENTYENTYQEGKKRLQMKKRQIIMEFS